jgi:archaellum component FlaC
MASVDEEVRRLKQKQKDELKEFEMNKTREISRLKDDFEITEKDLRDRINKLEMIKHNLEDVMSLFKHC